jgi:hypothetical protein
VCARALQREYAEMSIDTYLIGSYIFLEVWRKFAQKPNMLRPVARRGYLEAVAARVKTPYACTVEGEGAPRGCRCSQPNTTLLFFSRNLA